MKLIHVLLSLVATMVVVVVRRIGEHQWELLFIVVNYNSVVDYNRILVLIVATTASM